MPTGFRAALALGVLAAPLTAQARPDTLPVVVAQKQIDAFNRRDIDAFMAVYAPDAVVMEFPSGTVLWKGAAAIRAHYAAMLRELPADFPPVRIEPRIIDGSFVIENERWEARPGERNQAIWMYQIRAGLIRRVWTVRL
jgi:uncharacterized protein (TIGR02246 family)